MARLAVRAAVLGAVLALLAGLWQQHRSLTEQAARLGEAEAVSATLREHAQTLLRELDAVNAALAEREAAHAAIDAGREQVRREAAALLREPQTREWGDTPLPDGLFGLFHN